jgi:hypothetical protein
MPRRFRAPTAAIVLAAALLAAPACGSDEDPIGPADVAGSWSGTTSQNRAVEFDISSQGFARGSFSYQLGGTRCNAPRTIEVVGGAAVPIHDGEFSVPRTQIGPNAYLSAEGHFTSNRDANGTLTIEDGDCQSNITSTWTATKQ